MSNNQMVSVPRDELEAACERFAKAQIFDFSRRMRTLLDQPAEQHQGEPVLYYKSLSGAEAKPTGVCYSVFFAPMPGHQPLFAHADPAEVERLREQFKCDYQDFKRGRAKWWGERDSLRAQLAERDALIADVLIAFQLDVEGRGSCQNPGLDFIRPWSERVEALSASAEPSASHEEARWQPLTAPGQILEGDRLSFRVGSSFICARARQIIAPGTDKEEVVYNRKKNHYFLTSMAVDGTSSHKNVMVARVTA